MWRQVEVKLAVIFETGSFLGTTNFPLIVKGQASAILFSPGFHYGVSSCEACKAFFKRTIQGKECGTYSKIGLPKLNAGCSMAFGRLILENIDDGGSDLPIICRLLQSRILVSVKVCICNLNQYEMTHLAY